MNVWNGEVDVVIAGAGGAGLQAAIGSKHEADVSRAKAD